MQFAVKPWLMRIWHAPEHFRLMDPLPPLHRRGIILGAVFIVAGFLLPGIDNVSEPITRDAALSIQSQSPTQASLVPSVSTGSPRSEKQDHAGTFHENHDIDQQWRAYRVASGQTMAQLFRDHNLPPADVYAMAQVEGENKPLSNLQSGQMVQIRQNASGVVTGLTIDTGNDRQALFTRQANGSFIRVQ